jgi:hypothetical protein
MSKTRAVISATVQRNATGPDVTDTWLKLESWKSDTRKDSFLFQWETLPYSPLSANSNTSSRLSAFRQFVK